MFAAVDATEIKSRYSSTTESFKDRTVRRSRNPLVEDCEALCIFEDESNSWCFKTTPPILRVGWEWGQTFGKTSDTEKVKYYQLEFVPYFEAQFYLQSLFNITKLYYNELTADLAKFKMNYFMSIIINGNYQICPGLGFDTQKIDLGLTMS